VTGQVGSKRTRRQAAKEHRRIAAEKRARARRRSQIVLAALAGLAVVGIVVAVFLLVRGGDDGTDSLAPGTASSAGATPDATSDGFPPLPEGADIGLATRPEVKAGTGDITQLDVRTLIAGTGPAAESGKTVQVNYVGVTYLDGKEFDNSWDKKQTYPVTLGSGGVIQGWDLGLLNVNEGSRVQLDIPANLAYGEKAPAGYPSGDLRFVIDVLSVE